VCEALCSTRLELIMLAPFFIKYGHVRKPTIVKSYICIFVSLTVKAVHFELVSDLTTDAFIACLRRFISRRGIPSLIMEPISLELPENSKTYTSFYTVTRLKLLSLIFSPPTMSSGSSFHNSPLTSEACGRLLSSQ